MLIGEYRHNIDDKNRISLPKPYRAQLGSTIVVTRGLDNCLFCYPVSEWQKIAKKLGELGIGQAHTRSFNRFILSGAQEVNVDKNGRILLPEHLRDFAQIKTKVVVTGVYNRIELWDEKKWDTYQKAVTKDADSLAETLGEIGAI